MTVTEAENTAVVESTAATVLPSPVVTLETWAKRRADFNRFIDEQLREGIDYGKLPNMDKPTLLKPGAEKILQLYGCGVQLDVTRREHDIATGHLIIEVCARAVAFATGQIVGVGVGLCSTYESKYRYRWESWPKPNTTPPEGAGWEQAVGRYGPYWRRRIENRDLADQWNTVLKMAKKRAMVDLALTISGASERLTQDIEDLPEYEQAEPIKATKHETGNGKAQGKTAMWCDMMGKVGEKPWILKVAEPRSLTTSQALQMLGDLHQYATPEDAVKALDAAIKQAIK